MSLTRLILPAALRRQLAVEARAAYPAECCGLIEGLISGPSAEALALHPSPNLAAGPDRFEIDPAVHFALLRRLRGTGRAVIGCYHSHPDGAAAPSARDAAGAGEADFVWLIQAVAAAGEDAVAAYVSEGGPLGPLTFGPLSLGT